MHLKIRTIDYEDFKPAEYDEVTFLFSDIHVKNHRKVKNYLEQCRNLVSYCVTKLAQTDHSNIIFLGDFFDTHNPEPKELWVGHEILENLKSSVSNYHSSIYFLSGNHTKRNYNDCDINEFLFKTLKSEEEFKYINEPRYIELENYNLTMIPYHPQYITDPSTLVDALRFIETNNLQRGKLNILVLHLPLKNAVFDNGFLAETGCNLPSDAFTAFDLVLAGDFHTPQHVDYFDEPVFYIGAPFQMSFGDKFEPCVRFLCSKYGTFTLIQIPTTSIFKFHYEESDEVDNISFTRFITYYLDINDDYQSFDCKDHENYLIRFIGMKNKKSDEIVYRFRYENDLPSIVIYDDRSLVEINQINIDVASDNLGIKEYIDQVSNLSKEGLVNDFLNFMIVNVDTDETLSDPDRDHLNKVMGKHLKKISYSNIIG